MSPKKSLENLFGEALERDDPVKRSRFLDEACGADADLRQRLERLIKAHEEASGFMFDPSRKSTAVGSTGVIQPTGQTEKAGDTIGRYKLLEKIGEGGCGVVYMAEQKDPVRRRVALKVIKLGMDTKQVIARFDAERQALALMDHPNIAKVLDAGATDTGRPYFVMELIRGVRITDFCDEHRISTEARLKLCIQVCQAIQHAHQKGVIHRDIKPSNILVTVNDGVTMPTVIDFGIAKATQGRLTDQTLFTAFEQFVGTPAYMSPEQAVMTSLDVDTRSDIYSLGVLLYELLTGRPPFDQQELLAAGLDEMRRTIREKEPLKPSTRLRSLGENELTTAARRRQTEAPKLVHRVRGDLDWIVMKCLEKDRARRYVTANALALDLQRNLNQEPIVARPPSRLYRLQKFTQRNKAAFFSGLAIVAVLLVGTAVSTWQAVRATRAEHEQDHLRREAEAGRAVEAAARKKAEAREQIANAMIAYSSGEFEKAEKFLAGIPLSAIQPDLDHASLRRRLGTLHAIRSQWKEAAADFAVLRQVNVSDDSLVRELDILRFGPVLVELGATNEYYQFVEGTIRQWEGNSNPITCERVCKACLAGPVDEATLKRLAAFYEVAALGVDNIGDSGGRRWACTSLALFDYRRGNHAKAVKWATAAVEGPGGIPAFIVTGRLLRALAAHELHQETAGLEDLRLAREAVAVELKRVTGTSADNFPGFDYIEAFDWLRARILLREAEIAYGSLPGYSDSSH